MSFTLPNHHHQQQLNARNLASGVESDFQRMNLNGANSKHQRYLQSIQPESMQGVHDGYTEMDNGDIRSNTQGVEDAAFMKTLRQTVNGVRASQETARSVTSGLREETRRVPAGVTRVDAGRVLPAGLFEEPKARSTTAGAAEPRRWTAQEYHQMMAGISPPGDRKVTAGVWVEEPVARPRTAGAARPAAKPSTLNGVVSADEFFNKRSAAKPDTLNGVVSADDFFGKRSTTAGNSKPEPKPCLLRGAALAEKGHRVLEDGHIFVPITNEVLMNGSEVHEAFRSALNGACIKYCANCRETYGSVA